MVPSPRPTPIQGENAFIQFPTLGFVAEGDHGGRAWIGGGVLKDVSPRGPRTHLEAISTGTARQQAQLQEGRCDGTCGSILPAGAGAWRTPWPTASRPSTPGPHTWSWHRSEESNLSSLKPALWTLGVTPFSEKPSHASSTHFCQLLRAPE